MNTETKNAPAAKPETKPSFRRPRVGEIVHYFDDTRLQNYAKPGAGPYAAMVTLNDRDGQCLQIFGPRNGNFSVENIKHKSQLDPKQTKGRARWWNFHSETDAD